LIHYKDIGGYGDIQIAYGNQTSGDLMFTTSYTGVTFTIIDLNSMQSIYTAPSGYGDLWLTNSTYVIVNDYLYVYDLKTDVLLAKLDASMYVYSKEQSLVSFWNQTDEGGCDLTHIDLATGKRWITIELKDSSSLCILWPTSLRLTDKGTPEFVEKDFVRTHIMGERIFTEAYGELDFELPDEILNNQAVNFDFDNLTLYLLDYSPYKKTTEITFYTYDLQSKKFISQGSNLIENLPADNGFYPLNTTASVALANNTLYILNGINKAVSADFSGDWNFASSFDDSAGNQYVVLTKTVINDQMFQNGAAPGLFSNGNFVPLPGVRDDSVRAQAAGPNSYWIADSFGYSVGLVRYYDASGSNSNGEQTLISL
jgi:hypothetical protein